MMIKVHHQKKDFCYKRPKYREASWERAVKVYTINQESKYLLVQGVPAVGASKELVELFALYGDIEEYRLLHEYPREEFTEVYWIKYKKIPCARYGKKKLDNRSFFGGLLHVFYAPEYETVEDTREKLRERKRTVFFKSKEYLKGAKEKNISDNEGLSKVNTGRSRIEINPIVLSTKVNTSADLSPETFSSTISSYATTTSVVIDKGLPRLATKNATLPAELQNLSAAEVYPAYFDDINQKKVDNPDLKSRIENEKNISCNKIDTSFQLNKRENQIGNKRKCINWNKSFTDTPSSLLSTNTKSCYTSEPGAWYPFENERKKKGIEKHQIDITVSNIRNQLNKTLEASQDDSPSKEMSCPLQAVINTQLMQPRIITKKKSQDGRKRI